MLLLFCRKVYYNTKKYANEHGPLLLAVNHPNSFFDAIIIGCHFKQPVYFLARGDAFKNKWALKILTALHCIPVYRLREGNENLHLNKDTFEICRTIFKKNGIVLIFSEGICINEWKLRPLKKGTARLALSSWQYDTISDKLKILPVGINYSNYENDLPKVYVNFGEFIQKKEFNINEPEGNIYHNINKSIYTQLKKLCVDGIKNNHLFMILTTNVQQEKKDNFETIKEIEYYTNAQNKDLALHSNKIEISLTKKHRNKSLVKALLFFPLSIISLLFIMPFYFITKKFIYNKTKGTDHYHSVLLGVLTLLSIILLPVIVISFYVILKKWIFAIALSFATFMSIYFTKYFILNWKCFYNCNKITSEQRIVLQQFFNKN